jgi:uncharacterized BrkB/YihY/UPF0761 family membrane protein
MRKRFIALLVAACGLSTLLAAPLALATDVVDCTGLPADQCNLVSENNLDYTSKNNVVWNIVQFIFIILGGVAVIMIIVGGIQYATSQGDSGAVQKAKNTIMYAVIGLVVALVATAVVTFIIKNIPK